MSRYAVVLVAILALTLGFGAGWEAAIDSDSVVCHAPTEDSYLVDCEYHGGGWHRR
jgi:hypothetical protein